MEENLEKYREWMESYQEYKDKNITSESTINKNTLIEMFGSGQGVYLFSLIKENEEEIKFDVFLQRLNILSQESIAALADLRK